MPESVINDRNERIVRIVHHGMNMIHSLESVDDQDQGNGSGSAMESVRVELGTNASRHQGSLLIDATRVPDDIRYQSDLQLLNKAREVTEKLIT